MNPSEPLRRPLCVDLDGSLVSTDTLWESVFRLISRNPVWLLVIPFWLLAGRAAFKERVARRVRLDASSLPYRREVLALIKRAKREGRSVVLVTAANRRIADDVATYLALFDDVVGSDGHENMKAERKQRELVERYGERGYDYVGDSDADLAVWSSAAKAHVVGASGATLGRARALEGTLVEVLVERASRLKALLKQLRPHQWAKNGLVLVPVLLGEQPAAIAALPQALLAFVAFSLCASSGYVLNDLVDLDADRVHKTKHKRPLASGALPVAWGLPLFGLLFVAAFALSLAMSSKWFPVMLVIYFAGTLSYSFYFKTKTMLDVLFLAGLYTHRVLSGGIATGIPISAWLLAFSMFLFVSLAFAKRYIELLETTSAPGDTIKSRDYQKVDQDMVASMGPASGYIAVMIFALYLNSDKVVRVYNQPLLLWLACPVLLYWISRIWFKVRRGLVPDDPVRFAIKDKFSWFCALAIGAIEVLAKLLPAKSLAHFIE